MTDRERLRRQIGQLMVFGFEGLTVPDTMADLIRSHYVGNIIFFSRNVANREQVSDLTDVLQQLAREGGQELPLTISADQENGIVRRLPPDMPGLPGSMALGATGRPDNAFRSGVVTARLLKQVGINFNLAPVLDINNNPTNPVIGVRSYGDQGDWVAAYGINFMSGLQSEGVIALAKHFPGHGDTDVDSHRGLPVIAHGRSRLDLVELVPFVGAIAAGVDAIMTAHVVFPAVDPTRVAATLSRSVLTGLLRDELGFGGVLTTDCLEMDAISETVGVGPGAVAALKAGADMIMVSHRLDRQLQAIQAIEEAVLSGEIPESRIEEANARVGALKAKRLAVVPLTPDWASLQVEAKTLQIELSGQALTPLKWSGGLPQSPLSIAVLLDETTPVMVAAGRQGPNPWVKDAVSQACPAARVDLLNFPTALKAISSEDLLKKLAEYDLVVIGVNGDQNQPYLAFINTLFGEDIPQVTLLLRSPYDARLVGQAPNLLALYENTPWMVDAAIQSLFQGPALGRLPLEVSISFPRGYRAKKT